MAERYVRSSATGGTGTGASWANAHLTLAAALTAMASTDNIWIASDHAESNAAAVTLSYSNSATNYPNALSVNAAGSVPPVAADILAGASVTTTGAFAITANGRQYVYGLTYNGGTGAAAANLTLSGNAFMQYENCAFNLVNTAATSAIVLSASSASLDLNNCTVSFGAAGQGITVGGNNVWRNKPGSAAITGATLPTVLISAGTASGQTELRGLDLSALASGKTIVGAGVFSKVKLINCKLDAAVTVAASPTNRGAGGTYVIGCNSAGNVARNEIYLYGGTLTTETTIVRTGGASDGTTAYSWKIVPTANNKVNQPFETFEGSIWNATTGSAKTLTVHVVTDNVTLKDNEIWLEVEYLGAAGSPVASLISDGPTSVLAAGANQATSTETWTTTGLTTPLKQKLDVTFTPQMAGPIRWRVKYGKASTTVYVCPKADLT